MIGGALALAAVIPGDAAIAIAECSNLRREQLGAPQEAMREHDRLAGRARPGVLVIERRLVDLDRRHRRASYARAYRDASSVRRSSSPTGLTMWRSKPAARLRARSLA